MRRILVVEDDPNSREGLAMLLGGEGHEVVSCSNGAKALVLLQAATYDVLLTDYVMPGMSGVELALAACATYPALRCLIMSGQPPIETERPFRWLGKPLDLDALLAAVV